MSKKWYNYFVSTDQPSEGGSEESEQPAETGSQGTRPAASSAPGAGYRPFSPERTGAAKAPRSAAQTVAEIAASVAEPKFKTPVSNPTSFDEIYAAAEIRLPAHGYTIFKVADMLQSEHIRELPHPVKRSSVLVALDAAGVKIEEVIQDAVRRDQALDTYERVQQKALEELEGRKTKENRQIQAEIDRLVAEHQARIQANNDEVAKEKERIYGWRLKKQQEEQKIAEAVSYFVTENPVTTGGAAAAPPQSPKAQGSKQGS